MAVYVRKAAQKDGIDSNRDADPHAFRPWKKLPVGSSGSPDAMSEDLNAIKAELRQALKVTHQGSYNRRASSKRAIPLLARLRTELASWIEHRGETAEALRLLALAEEALLNYEAAVVLLEKIVRLGPRASQKDLKRLAACRQASQMWHKLRLTPDELNELGRYLKDKLLDTAEERSLRWTENWLSDNRPQDQETILDSIRELGFFSDYQVLHNLIPG